MPWYRIPISAEQAAGGVHIRVQSAFEKLWTSASGPKDAAMFSCGRPGRAFELYFSPGADRIAHALIESSGGIASEAPSKDDTKLVVGHAGARADRFS
jgi:hypothetical protein